MMRGRLDIQSNDIWFSDHHLMDVMVLDKLGNPKRPWLTTFFDARAGRVMGHIVRIESPDARVIKRCFKLAVYDNNKVLPKEFYFDNGKDYRSKAFKTDFPLSLVNRLGIGMIYATPYHGQAKTVERFFGTLETRFGKFFPGYIGRNARERPEHTSNEELANNCMPLDEFKTYIAASIREYNETPSRGIDMMGKSPNDVYTENLPLQVVLLDEVAINLVCGDFETRTVQPNGIQYKNCWYESKFLLRYLDKTVWVSWNEDDINNLFVLDTEYHAICTAYAKLRVGFRHKTTAEDYERVARLKKKARKQAETRRFAEKLDIRQLISKEQTEEQEAKEAREAGRKPENEVQGAVFQNMAALKTSGGGAAAVRQGKRERADNTITAALNKKYEKEAANAHTDQSERGDDDLRRVMMRRGQNG